MARTITVKGVGYLKAKVDYVVVGMQIEVESGDCDRAMQEAAARIEKIRDALAGIGYEKEELKTIKFRVDVRQRHERDSRGNYEIVFDGYACIYECKLAFDFDKKRMAQTLAAISASGANAELKVDFTVKDPSKISEELLARAAQNAKEKADVLCRASGSKLGTLLSIDYHWEELSVVSHTECEFEDILQPLMAKNSGRGLEMEPDDIRVSDTVTFQWEIV